MILILFTLGSLSTGFASSASYYPDYVAADQGDEHTPNTVAAFLGSIGDDVRAQIVFRHNSTGTTTDYTLTTPVVSNSKHTVFKLEPGARISIAPSVTVTFYSPENIVASPRQQIITGEGNLRFIRGGVVYAEWFGDIDGIADNVQIQAAMDCLEETSNGGILQLLDAYTITVPITLESSQIWIKGMGVGQTFITSTINNDYALKINPNGDLRRRLEGIILEDFTLFGSGGDGKHGIHFNYVTWMPAIIQRLFVSDFTGKHIHIDNSWVSKCRDLRIGANGRGNYGLYMETANVTTVEQVQINNLNHTEGVGVYAKSGSAAFKQVNVEKVSIGFDIDGSYGPWVIDGAWTENNYSMAIRLGSTANPGPVNIINSHILGSTAIYISEKCTSSVAISNCFFGRAYDGYHIDYQGSRDGIVHVDKCRWRRQQKINNTRFVVHGYPTPLTGNSGSTISAGATTYLTNAMGTSASIDDVVFTLRQKGRIKDFNVKLSGPPDTAGSNGYRATIYKNGAVTNLSVYIQGVYTSGSDTDVLSIEMNDNFYVKVVADAGIETAQVISWSATYEINPREGVCEDPY
jgi:hypothetical protein